MDYVNKLYAKTFYDSDKKEAYLKACKWLATNVISRESELLKFTSSKLLYKIEQVKTSQTPAYKLVLFVQISESELRERMCDLCRDINTKFYIRAEKDCSKCEMLAYTHRMDEAMQTALLMFSKRLRGIINNG